MPKIDKNSPIIVVGAGAFGLSNAYHLSQSGYSQITVFDRLDMDVNGHSVLSGADTASADLNKIFRAQYETARHYQDLAFRALGVWEQWDYELGLLPAEERAQYAGLQLLDHCGMLWADDVLSQEEIVSRQNFARDGLGSLVYDLDCPEDMRRGAFCGYGTKLQLCKDLQARHPSVHGFFDPTAGMLYASRACRFLRAKCAAQGVRFVLGGDAGTFARFVESADGAQVHGIVTKDGRQHLADLTVVACGPWSTSIVPELDGINEATCGNVLLFKVPQHRRDLQVKYSSAHCPLMAWRWAQSREREHMAGVCVFPLTSPEGYMKLLIRQQKNTNPVQVGNKVISIPKTENSSPPFKYLTKSIMDQAKQFLSTFFPDLVSAGIKLEPKIMWYTDTINSDFIFDFVPNRQGLFVSCGGSGHAFKMMPVLGEFLVNAIEGHENLYTKLFKWRCSEDYEDVNGLREKMDSHRRNDKQEMSDESDLYFGAGQVSDD